GPGRAHHSFAMFDRAATASLTGTVKELQWTAPHVLLWVTADPKDGQAQGILWTIELSTGPGMLSRLGWSKRSLVPGDRITVEFNPLRSGEPGGSFKKCTILKTGEVLATGAPPPDMDDIEEPAPAKQ
ncbi:MAG: hypothetical protein JO021_24030, partial [Alphaproteobacteria bacterium]|nr:hypothetical protein [Alphaproteobacteria bacterium]